MKTAHAKPPVTAQSAEPAAKDSSPMETIREKALPTPDSSSGNTSHSTGSGCSTTVCKEPAGIPGEDASPETVPASSGSPQPSGQKEETMLSETEIEARIAEAENRGYLRGRNERIDELMREPPALQRPETSNPAGPETSQRGSSSPWHDWQGDSQPMILNNPRISIWDK